MQPQLLPEIGSFARFFLETVAMFLLVSALAFCLITVAYAGGPTAHRPLAGKATQALLPDDI